MSRERRQIFSEINITPLTDIFLVLLIVMMVIAPLLDSKGLKLAVPVVGKSASTATDPNILNVHVDAKGNYTVNNQPVSSADLQQQLFQQKDKYVDGLMITVEPDALHGAVVHVMDAAREAGIVKIAVTSAS